MSLAASPPHVADQENHLRDQLDAEIEKVRNEIQKLTKDRARLSAALLSSSRVQNHIRNKTPHNHGDDENTPLRHTEQALHNQINVHRLAFGVTSFPFTDPAPENKSQPPLLGVRIDVPSRTGRFEQAPYYIFLKRTNPRSSQVQVHRHTIPAFVDIERYATKYLLVGSEDDGYREGDAVSTRAGGSRPVAQREDEGYYGSESRSASVADDAEAGVDTEMHDDDGSRQPVHLDGNVTRPRHSSSSDAQDLHAFIGAVRQDLISRTLRLQTISYLAECLDLPSAPPLDSVSVSGQESAIPALDIHSRNGKYSVLSLGATTADAYFVRVIWKDGSLGRLKISEMGEVRKVVVVGKQEQMRLSEAERLLSQSDNGQPLQLKDLVGRLQILEERKFWVD